MGEHHENEKSMIFKKNVENEKMQNLRKTIFRGWRELAGALRELFCKLFQNFGGGGSLRELAGACGSFRELGFSIFLSFSFFHFLGF